MELRHLRYFVAVAEELHFGRAAARLRVAQPALSKQIRQLEEEVGAELIDRSDRRLRLTRAGSEFLRGAREVIAMSERTLRDARRAAGCETEQLSVAFAPSILHSAEVTGILRRFEERNPAARLEVLTLCSQDQWTALRTRRIQVGVLYQPPGDPALSAEPLWEVEFFAAMPRGHRLASAASLTLRQLANAPLIWFDRSAGPRYHDVVRSAFEAQGLTMNVVHEASDESSRLTLVAGGFGLTLVVGASGHAMPGVELRPVADLREKLRVYAVHEPSRPTAMVPAFLAEMCAGKRDERRPAIAFGS